MKIDTEEKMEAEVTVAEKIALELRELCASVTEKIKKGKEVFVIVKSDDPLITIIEKKVGRPNVSRYPFDELEINCSFFFPNSLKRKDAVAHMSSITSKINGKYRVVSPDGLTVFDKKGVEIPVMVRLKQFKVLRCKFDGIEGALVSRAK